VITISIFTGYAAYLPAEELNASAAFFGSDFPTRACSPRSPAGFT
jgi:hypothetical protein